MTRQQGNPRIRASTSRFETESSLGLKQDDLLNRQKARRVVEGRAGAVPALAEALWH